jgi:Uncharacterized protein conserved in bacteria (DUF2188)
VVAVLSGGARSASFGVPSADGTRRCRVAGAPACGENSFSSGARASQGAAMDPRSSMTTSTASLVDPAKDCPQRGHGPCPERERAAGPLRIALSQKEGVARSSSFGSERGRWGRKQSMPKKGDVHVVPHERRWRVEVEGSARPRSTHDTQAEARQAARDIARRNRSELLVHGRNGQVRERNTYGHDPRRRRARPRRPLPPDVGPSRLAGQRGLSHGHSNV